MMMCLQHLTTTETPMEFVRDLLMEALLNEHRSGDNVLDRNHAINDLYS